MPNHRYRRYPPASASILFSLIVLAALSVVQLTRTTTRLGSSFRTTPTGAANSHAATTTTTNSHTTASSASVGKARANISGLHVGQTEQEVRIPTLAAATTRQRRRQEAKQEDVRSNSGAGVDDEGLKRSHEFPQSEFPRRSEFPDAKPEQQPHHQAAITEITDQTPPFNLTSYSTLFLYHTRKAGGTTLRSFLASVASHHNLTFAVQEGKVFDPTTQFDPSGRTLYVTSLRDPVERAMSSYWFEGRWPQKTPTRHCNESNARNLTEWIAYTERRIERKTDAFVKRIAKQRANNITQSSSNKGVSQSTRQSKKKGVRIWGCASNCYTKWFGGWPQPNSTPNLSNAIATLQRFDLIVHTERMKDDSYVQNLARIMGVTATTVDDGKKENDEEEKEEEEEESEEEKEEDVAPLTHLRATKSSSRKVKSNYTIPEEDMELLREMNRKDMELYRHFFGSDEG